MAKPKRANRKASDADIVRLNALGYSLAQIGKAQGCHPTTITLRLEALGIPPADTRRAFMQDVLSGFSDAQLDWVISKLGPATNIKQLVKNLLLEGYLRDNP